MQPRGCHIEDVAPDGRLDELCSAFLNFVALDLSPGAGTFQAKVLADSGLDQESPETFLTLKGIFAEWQEYEAKRKGGGR